MSEVLQWISTGLMVAVLGVILNLHRVLGNVEGRCTERGKGCDIRFIRDELDIRNSQSKSILEGNLKIDEDADAQERLQRMESDIKYLQER